MKAGFPSYKLGVLSITDKYSSLSILLQSMHIPIFDLRIKSNHILVALAFPYLKGCATLISTYFSIILSKLDSGIFSTIFKFDSKNLTGAKRKLSFDKLTILIFPAKSNTS